ncbi:hypothetical protein GGF45_004783, partial [Coemansia sp. RSA 551]
MEDSALSEPRQTEMQQPEAQDPETQQTETQVKRVLIGATGSVASIKIPQLCRNIMQQGTAHGLQIEIAIAASSSALHFFRHTQLPETN